MPFGRSAKRAGSAPGSPPVRCRSTRAQRVGLGSKVRTRSRPASRAGMITSFCARFRLRLVERQARGLRLTRIGELTRERHFIVERDGGTEPLPAGFVHF